MSTIDEEVVRRTAKILGPFSAAARALEEAQKKRSEGMCVEYLLAGNAIVVASRPVGG